MVITAITECSIADRTVVASDGSRTENIELQV